jgi:hypothetical protein
MGILYKEPKDVIVSVEITQKDGLIEFDFTADCGKHATDENLAGYKFTVERLLKIFASLNDVSDDELL